LPETEVDFERETVVGSMVWTVLGVEFLDEILFSINSLH
jgi:hypothetical protein